MLVAPCRYAMSASILIQSALPNRSWWAAALAPRPPAPSDIAEVGEVHPYQAARTAFGTSDADLIFDSDIVDLVIMGGAHPDG